MIKGYAAKHAGEELQQWEYDPGTLENHEVEIDITHCGICHSDIHLIDDDWGMSSYPFIPGHEVVGTVADVGENVHDMAPGDRVAVGWQADSCETCEWCMQADENLCAENQPTAIGRNGGFAEAIRVNSRFAFHVPDALDSERTAPLLCGGITVYTPLQDIPSSKRVGVVGIGGLGHFALQFANAKGHEVTAFSTSPQKEKEAKELGADHFVMADDPDAVAAQELDFILSTVPVVLDYDAYLAALRPKGTFCNVGAVPNPMEINAQQLLVGDKQVIGSNTGGTNDIKNMLTFAARHDIGAVTERYEIGDVNKALQKVRKGNAKYRVVLSV
jgi:uncharacterized zinc-type alcohol dehydrogenase-like protein